MSLDGFVEEHANVLLVIRKGTQTGTMVISGVFSLSVQTHFVTA